jgi:hypothetical protein
VSNFNISRKLNLLSGINGSFFKGAEEVTWWGAKIV